MIQKKSLFGGIAIGIILCLVGGRVFDFVWANSITFDMPMTVNGKLSRIYRLLDKHFIYDFDKTDIEEGIYYGLVAMLDDNYTAYLDAETVKSMNERYSGFYAGIGVTVDLDEEDNLIRIVEVSPNSPAEESGIVIGDKIIQVNGTAASGDNYDDIIEMIRGEADTAVNITIYRQSENASHDLTVIRKMVNYPTIKHKMLDNNVGLIAITNFDNGTPKLFKLAFDELLSSGMRSIIIDVRDNPGGTLSSLVEISDFLVDAEYLLYMENKNGERQYYYGKPDKTDIPIFVLINKKSASAAELLAAILSEKGDAVLIGETTFGKGSVQTTYALPDGSALNITSAKYFTPGGVSVQGVGVSPDFEIADADEQMKKAIELAAQY